MSIRPGAQVAREVGAASGMGLNSIVSMSSTTGFAASPGPSRPSRKGRGMSERATRGGAVPALPFGARRSGSEPTLVAQGARELAGALERVAPADAVLQDDRDVVALADGLDEKVAVRAADVQGLERALAAIHHEGRYRRDH